MRPALVIATLVLTAASALAAPKEGVYRGSDNRALTVSGATDNYFEFALAVGTGDGENVCIEGDVSCLSVTGLAEASAEGFTYVDPDGEGSITFEIKHEEIVITKAEGSLGSGSGNAQQLGSIAGVYQPLAQSSSEESSQPKDVFFQTPSGNISCAIFGDGGGFVRCDMQQLKQTFVDKPIDCDLDWGAVFGIAGEGTVGEVVCHGDTLFGTSPMKLEYGRSVEALGFTCQSEKTGLTCKNAAGHGFALSKARQEVF